MCKDLNVIMRGRQPLWHYCSRRGYFKKNCPNKDEEYWEEIIKRSENPRGQVKVEADRTTMKVKVVENEEANENGDSKKSTAIDERKKIRKKKRAVRRRRRKEEERKKQIIKKS